MPGLATYLGANPPNSRCTVRDAAERGYGCVVIGEATADYDEYAHEASLRALAFNHCRVVESVDTVLDAIVNGEQV